VRARGARGVLPLGGRSGRVGGPAHPRTASVGPIAPKHPGRGDPQAGVAYLPLAAWAAVRRLRGAGLSTLVPDPPLSSPPQAPPGGPWPGAGPPPRRRGPPPSVRRPP